MKKVIFIKDHPAPIKKGTIAVYDDAAAQRNIEAGYIELYIEPEVEPEKKKTKKSKK